jgi:hypothetical protein
MTAGSSAEGELPAANQEWRHKAASHRAGPRPSLEPARDHLLRSDHPTGTVVEYGGFRSPVCVAAAVQSGADSGVNDTPTFFINEERLDWAFEPATLIRALERAATAA